MKVMYELIDSKLVEALKSGDIGVLRTDTIYGIVASAGNQHAVERIYHIKQRDSAKQLIVLVSSVDQLFDQLTVGQQKICNKYWPGKTSIILPTPSAPDWLTRGGGTLAYRLPADQRLRDLIAQTGPLVAPSANPESLPPASTIEEAYKYFGNAVDFYVDGGDVTENIASTLLSIDEDNQVIRLR